MAESATSPAPTSDCAALQAEISRLNEALAREREEQQILIGKLEDAHEQLLQAEKLACIGQLAAGVAHEINNPIGFVNSNLDALKSYVEALLVLVDEYALLDATAPAELRQRVEKAKQNADLDFLRQDIVGLIAESIDGASRVRRIVQDLRDFSRPGQAEWQEADLHAGLESTLNVVSNEIKYKADIIREYGNLPPVECLPFQLNQVFLNLLVNAAHAIPQFGRITLRTACDGDFVTVAVSDTGCGIAATNLDRIFDPFFTTKPVGKGSGLGLSVAYGIVAKHGGRIDVDSEPGVGSTFSVRLPIRRLA